MSGVNATVIYIGLIVLAIASGFGEHFGAVPMGTTTTIIGAIVGGGLFHGGTIIGANTSTNTSTNQPGNKG